MGNPLQILQVILIAIIPLILAITLHEAAHGWAAKKLGDNTAYSLGRVSLNPLVHIDWVGTVALPAIMFALTGFMFGWAKPVPVKFGNLRNPRVHSMIVAGAGPAANLLMSMMWAVLFYFTKETNNEYVLSIAKIASAGITINIIFMLFNLIPILPLDGGRILQGLLPVRQAIQFEKIEPYGIWIVFGLAFFGILSPILGPLSHMIRQILIF